MATTGPSMMYQVQRPAFEARTRILDARIRTPSSATSPPEEEAVDAVAFTALKQQVLQTLPTHCTHCGKPLPPRAVLETRDGAVMAYCRDKAGCGRSQVLFAGVDLSTAVFEQVCPYRRKEKVVQVEEEQQVYIGDTNIPAVDLQQQQHVFQMQEEQIQQLIASTYLGEITMEDHDPSCALCGKGYISHKHDCDENGWRVARRKPIRLPSNWPIYSETTGTWHTKEGNCSSSIN